MRICPMCKSNTLTTDEYIEATKNLRIYGKSMEEIKNCIFKEKKSFEDFLMSEFVTKFPQYLDDDYPDEFDSWLAEMQVEDLIILGNKYGKELLK